MVGGQYTHIATNISYRISYNGNSAIFEFNPFDKQCVVPWRHASIMGKLFENAFLASQQEKPIDNPIHRLIPS